MWNTGPSWSSSCWFYLRLVLLSLSSFFQPSAFPILLCFFQVVLGLPLFLVPGGFQFNVCLSTVSCGFHSVWPSQRHFLSLISCSVGVCFVLYHNFSYEIFSSHLTFKVCWHQFTNIWTELLTNLVIFHVSHPYNRTDLTFVLNNSVSRSWWWAKYCPKHVELIL